MSTVMFRDLSAFRGCLSSQHAGSNVHKPESVLVLSSCAVAYQLLSVDYQACFPVISQLSADVFSAELMKSSPTAFLFSAPLYWCSWHVYWLMYIDGCSLHFSSGCSVVLGKVYSADLSQSDNKQSLQNLFVNLLDICMYWPFSVSSNSWLIPK